MDYSSSPDESIEVLMDRVETLVAHFQQGQVMLQELKEENQALKEALKEALKQTTPLLDKTSDIIEQNFYSVTSFNPQVGKQLQIFAEISTNSSADFHTESVISKKVIQHYIQAVDACITRLENSEDNYA